MPGSPTDRLAPVSYLPGVLPPSGGPSDGGPSDGGPSDTEGGPDTSAGTRAAKLAAVNEAFDNWTSDPGDRPGKRGERDRPDERDQPGERPTAGKKAARRAENVSMNALTRRGMSRREVERVLVARELDEATVAAELDRLQGVGLIDDHALATDLVSRLRDRKGLGRTAVAAELARRMLPNDVITEALDSIESDDELETARQLAAKRAGQLRSLDSVAAERRLSGFLQRRGYSGDIVRTAVAEALRGGGTTSGVTFR